jgi:ssDNA-binding Zn-finger/Zn-ribbon topoisomerase 1
MSHVSPNPQCPRCNSPMVLRHGKCGRFYGCSRYPECRGTREVSEEHLPTVHPPARLCAKCKVRLPRERVAAMPGERLCARCASAEAPAAPQCWACNGQGYAGRSKCSICRGVGRLVPSSQDSYDRYGRELSEPPGYLYRDDRNGNRKRT